MEAGKIAKSERAHGGKEIGDRERRKSEGSGGKKSKMRRKMEEAANE